MSVSRQQNGIHDRWDGVPLRSLCQKTRTTDPTKNPNSSFEYVDVSSISNELWKITITTRHTGATAPSRARKLVQSRDVIFATVRPTLKRVALVPDDLNGQIVSTAFCVLRADPTKADSHFLYYSLLTDDFIAQMENLQRGASYPAVADSDVLEQEIAVPPLPEQRGIAAVLAKIQAAVEVQDKIVATLKELKAATMAKLFHEGLRGESLKQTEIGEIPESWKVVPLHKIANVIMGQSPPGSTYNRERIGRPLINGPAEFGPLSPNPIQWTSQPTKLCSVGDILFCVRGNTAGRMNIADQGYCIGRGVASINGKEGGAKTKFIFYLLQLQQPKILKIAEPGGSTFPNISGAELKNYLVARPMVEEQQKIVEILEAIDEKITDVEKIGKYLKALFSSMLHLLMTGQVRVTGNIQVKR